ncbi:MAG: hypothetical protein ACRDPT_11415 [Streptomycetales bacterium]
MAGPGPVEPERLGGGPRLGPRLAGVTLLGLAWAGVSPGFTAFTWPARAATAGIIGTVLILAVRHDAAAPRMSGRAWLARARQQVREHPRRAGAAAWGLLIVLATAWELLSFFGGPRSQHPTLSSIADDLQADRGVDTLIRVLWLGFGWWLVRR